MGQEDDHRDKHVSFDDGTDGLSSASDEDRKAVEVTFDPAQNPYRRKSSLVTTEATVPKIRAAPKKTQCLVHQFLDSQRRARHASQQHTQRDTQHDTQHAHRQRHQHDLHESQPGGIVVEASSSASGSRQPVESKGSGGRCSVLDNGASDSAGGQVDELHWREGIAETPPDTEAALHSRLLTKKQLSDMAWGVRELSRRLGSMKLKFRVKSIFLLTKIYDEDLLPKARELTRWLLDKERDVRYTVYLERNLKDNKLFDASGMLGELRRAYAVSENLEDQAAEQDVTKQLRWWDEDMCRARPHTFDFVITLGGDGTVLYASWLFQRIVPPVLSFSLGSLGFLTKFEFDDYRQILGSAFDHGVTVSLRLRFEGTVMRSVRRSSRWQSGDEDATNEKNAQALRRRDLVEELIGEEKDDEHTHHPDGTYEVLNEIVVDRGPNPTLSSTEIFGDDEHFTSVQADGVCVSTPTGSTAYNLAAGGSLCHPENPVMLVTAICAHTLSFRPIILPDTIVLRIGVPYDARTSSWASFDGRERLELKPGDYVTISASRYPFASVQAQGRRSEDWVNSISGKLGWNTRQKQKSYKQWEN